MSADGSMLVAIEEKRTATTIERSAVVQTNRWQSAEIAFGTCVLAKGEKDAAPGDALCAGVWAKQAAGLGDAKEFAEFAPWPTVRTCHRVPRPAGAATVTLKGRTLTILEGPGRLTAKAGSKSYVLAGDASSNDRFRVDGFHVADTEDSLFVVVDRRAATDSPAGNEASSELLPIALGVLGLAEACLPLPPDGDHAAHPEQARPALDPFAGACKAMTPDGRAALFVVEHMRLEPMMATSKAVWAGPGRRPNVRVACLADLENGCSEVQLEALQSAGLVPCPDPNVVVFDGRALAVTTESGARGGEDVFLNAGASARVLAALTPRQMLGGAFQIENGPIYLQIHEDKEEPGGNLESNEHVEVILPERLNWCPQR